MDLKDFVSETLLQIIQGVTEAQKTAMQHGAYINAPDSGASSLPTAVKKRDAEYLKIGTNDFFFREVQVIEFDVAVTATSGTETKGGIGVAAGIIGLGSSGKSDSSSETVNRIKFKIPVVFPHQPGSHPRVSSPVQSSELPKS